MAKKKVSMSIPEDKKEELSLAQEDWVKKREVPEEAVEDESTASNSWSSGKDIPSGQSFPVETQDGSAIRGLLWLMLAFVLGWIIARLFQEE